MDSSDLDGFVTIRQAIEILRARGITAGYEAIQRWCQRGILPARKHADRARRTLWLIAPEDLARFVPPRRGRPPVANPSAQTEAQRRSRSRRAHVGDDLSDAT